MERFTHILSYFELVGAFQGFLLFWLLVQAPSPSRLASRLLAALLLTLSLHLLWTALHDSHYLAYVPDLISLGPGLALLFGPLLYLYVKICLRPDARWKNLDGWHFFPFLLLQAGHIPFFARPYAEKKTFILNHYTHHPALDAWSQLPVLHFLLYMIPVLILLGKHRQALKACFSDIDRLKLGWLQRLIGVFGALWLVFIAGNAVANLQLAGSAFALLMSGFLYYTGYQFIRHPVLLPFPAAGYPAPAPAPNASVNPEAEPRKKYEKSELPPARVAQYAERLRELMEREKLYRQSGLTLKDLADGLSVSTHQLSQVLNQHLKTNFYDFVNGYRVEEVKAELPNPHKKHLTILALALDAGFDSKTTFNAVFKKHTGLTPSAYKKQQRG
jgi:AraC-like DNA-binding protein